MISTVSNCEQSGNCICCGVTFKLHKLVINSHYIFVDMPVVDTTTFAVIHTLSLVQGTVDDLYQVVDKLLVWHLPDCWITSIGLASPYMDKRKK